MDCPCSWDCRRWVELRRCKPERSSLLDAVSCSFLLRFGVRKDGLERFGKLSAGNKRHEVSQFVGKPNPRDHADQWNVKRYLRATTDYTHYLYTPIKHRHSCEPPLTSITSLPIAEFLSSSNEPSSVIGPPPINEHPSKEQPEFPIPSKTTTPLVSSPFYHEGPAVITH
ncbi:hypothetical protein NPIL_9571 [Nephila pilipes]|uniref:Uncharacterized protein n=1 Tax=Nephila pilipes TaxID=299642 RepID=A0A8X6IL36_NEPPI|nr:hypothetical protein NPIL_9571 [Nephila pilipes]